MNLVVLHQKLFGTVPSLTPKELRITPQQRRLYKGFPDVRGFSVTLKQSKEWRNQEQLVAALIVAFAQTRPHEDRIVYLLMPRHYAKWAACQLQEACRHIVQRREGHPESIQRVMQSFQQLSIRGPALTPGPEPAYWAAYGFCSEGVLPGWIARRLIKAKA